MQIQIQAQAPTRDLNPLYLFGTLLFIRSKTPLVPSHSVSPFSSLILHTEMFSWSSAPLSLGKGWLVSDSTPKEDTFKFPFMNESCVYIGLREQRYTQGVIARPSPNLNSDILGWCKPTFTLNIRRAQKMLKHHLDIWGTMGYSVCLGIFGA